MPTYEYRCANCGHELERFQQMSENPIRKCPKCKRMKLRRLMGTGSGIIFKGSGFYETDYKRKHASPASSCSSGSNGAASGSSKPAKEKTESAESSKESKKKD